MDPEELRWIREEAVGALGPGTRAGDVRVLQRRQGALVLAVEVGGAQVVLRLTGPGAARGDDERTAAVVGLVRAAGVPAPAVLATAPAVRSGWRVVVEEHVDGVPWLSAREGLTPAQLAVVHEELAAALVAVQSVPLSGSGSLTEADVRRECRCS